MRPTATGKWKVSYFKNSSPNVGKSMIVGRSVHAKTEGSDSWVATA